ncbi:MAG: hypothetical protein ACFE8U_01175 [Candidatus Hermodarchaeota archaeon]
MSDYETYIHYGRLVVILQFLLIPIYFYLLSFTFIGGVIWFLNTPELQIISDFIVYIIGPIIMSVPFLMWTYGHRYQISDAYETFGREVWRLPTTIKAFYGLNFVIGLIYLFPLISPIISLAGGYFIAVYLLGWREEGERFSNQRRTIILTFLYLPLPLLVVLGFYFGYDIASGQYGVLNFFLRLIEIWTKNIDFLYTSALILADAATVGGVLYLIYEGAQQVDHTVTIPELPITLISAVCFIILESLFIIFSSFGPFLGYIHIGAVLIGILMLVIRYGKGLTTSKDTSIVGWLTLVFFQIVNFAQEELRAISRSTAILLAFTIFFFLFWIAYRHAGKRY